MNYRYVLVYFLYINLFLFISSFYFGLGHQFLNLDYLFLLIFCCIPKNIFTSILLVVSYLFIYFVDILLVVIQIFPFVRLMDIVYLSNFVFYGPVLYRILLWVVLVNALINVFLIKNYFFNNINLKIKHYFYIVLIVVFTLIANQFLPSQVKGAVHARINEELVGSQVLFFIKNHQSTFVQAAGKDVTKLEHTHYKNATLQLFSQLNESKTTTKKILMIVNESWGETANSEHQMAILSPIYSRKEKLEYINQGAFNFIGATVAGELRELCQKQSSTFNLKDVNNEEFKDCLPNKLKRIGYKTYAVHGAMSIMYDRSSWYPKAGFDQFYSFEQLNNAGVCFSFSGRCDIKIIPYIKSFLLNSDKSFVYWLTLNSHAPYDDRIFYEGFNCKYHGIKAGTETCKNFRLQYQFFYSLATLIDDPKMSGVEVYVAGDHSPPIFDIGENFFSYKNTDVAWIHFKIK
ncbi:sulfatase-like hydrolase/transferase [Acinetobacter sp. ANC 3813]|uniref:sulfatase-like hydrolase/transferase n=1 Tax=Acinetobacter sp. ANC 3813 TaxID=1977873 RepID=UPI000A33EE17|nr:sulfatase-like hydrolase/transferase [Acinetobacter sp. ANC 3813]OTG89695.1 hypothetical protein B9T34_10810 [Acinetobacter sp. ANC 3813]